MKKRTKEESLQFMRNYSEAYNLKYKDYIEFEWLPHHVNQIESNPVEGIDCKIITDNGYSKEYHIGFLYEHDETGTREQYPEIIAYSFFDNDSFICIYNSIEHAKMRAWWGYAHIYGYVHNKIRKNID